MNDNLKVFINKTHSGNLLENLTLCWEEDF